MGPCFKCRQHPASGILRRCGGCLVFRYCGRACQHEDWAVHKLVCKRFCFMREMAVLPLLSAAMSGDVAAVQRLLEAGTTVQLDASLGLNGRRTPLFAAVHKGHEEVVAVLLQAGAKVDKVMKEGGYTPLYEAVMQDHNRVMTVLLREGANVDAMVKDGLTPLIYAAGNGRDAMVYILLETGADVNKAADDWCTALHGAAFSGSETVLAALLRAGASVNPRVLDDGWSPLFFAVQKEPQKEKEGIGALVSWSCKPWQNL